MLAVGLAALGTTAQASHPAAETRPAAASRTCNRLDDGRLCLTVDGSTVDLNYDKTAGGHITARFKYTFRGQDHLDEGAFTLYAGRWASYQWKGQRLGCGDIIGQLVVEGERTYSTPPINPCR
ncbi:hypothetical protein AC230_06860 [Streptomyces caatingaensis]|uniref:Uncharacterized protein n=1 Tax=Streptomyces caatingaensis TaxID=1678637 RepID=A0A0K9XIG9_9ACTN|nr:hypothetical protein AC230_06860 [Streptomyces caatingaensis]